MARESLYPAAVDNFVITFFQLTFVFQLLMGQELDDKRQAEIEAILDGVTQAVEELEQLTLGWALDHDAEKTYLDVTASARPGTDLAEWSADPRGRRSAPARPWWRS